MLESGGLTARTFAAIGQQKVGLLNLQMFTYRYKFACLGDSGLDWSRVWSFFQVADRICQVLPSQYSFFEVDPGQILFATYRWGSAFAIDGRAESSDLESNIIYYSRGWNNSSILYCYCKEME